MKNKTYKRGQLVWFLKSMAMCSFVEYQPSGLVTVERVDNGKRLTATRDGIAPMHLK